LNLFGSVKSVSDFRNWNRTGIFLWFLNRLIFFRFGFLGLLVFLLTSNENLFDLIV
jgi:hypothetical protein